MDGSSLKKIFGVWALLLRDKFIYAWTLVVLLGIVQLQSVAISEVIGHFSVTALNGPLCVNACSTCKSEKISQETHPPTRGPCLKVTSIIRIPKVKGRILTVNGSEIQIHVCGGWVNEILNLTEPFMAMLDRDGLGLRSLLYKYEVEGHFMIDHFGDVRGFERPKMLALRH